MDIYNKLIFGVLPACLKNGSNPASFRTGKFPILSGSSAPEVADSDFLNYPAAHGYLNTGTILTTSDKTASFKVNTTGYSNTVNKQKTLYLRVRLDQYPTHGSVMFHAHNAIGAEVAALWQYNVGAGVKRMQSTFYSDFNTYVTAAAMSPLGAMNDKALTYGVFLVNDNATGSFSLKWILSNNSSVITADTRTGKTHNLASCPGVSFGNTRIPSDPNYSFYPGAKYYLDACMLYDRILTDADMISLFGLGADLGGLKGYDSGNGHMTLTPTVVASNPVEVATDTYSYNNNIGDEVVGV